MKKSISVEELMKGNPSIMENRAFGIIIIAGKYAKFNAGFDGNPKNFSGEFVASDVAKKYANRNYWDKKGLQVFGVKSYKKGKETVEPRNIDDRYKYLFGKDPNKKDLEELRKNLFNCIDSINFGYVFAGKNATANVTGAIQFGYGIDKNLDDDATSDMCLTPWQNLNSGGEQSSAGTKTFLNDQHFSYGFTVTPWNYDILKDSYAFYKGYPRVAYDLFKESSLIDVTLLNSQTKTNCYNEFAMFIELVEGSYAMASNINDLVELERDEKGKVIINLKRVFEQLNTIEKDIKSIELYYNPYATEINFNEGEVLQDRISSFNILNPSKGL